MDFARVRKSEEKGVGECQGRMLEWNGIGKCVRGVATTELWL